MAFGKLLGQKVCVISALYLFGVYIYHYHFDKSLSSLFNPNHHLKNNQKYEKVAILVRTYKGHFLYEKPYNILKMLTSLQSLEYKLWEAFLINTDSGPLPKVPLNDSRISILSISPKVAYDEWMSGYDLTDEAIARLEKSDFKWVVITNGDNIYHKEFLNGVKDAGNFDLILSDYYSRYERDDSVHPTTMNATVCHSGRLEGGYIDLGGVIISLPKFISHKLKFSGFGAVNAQDGFMFTAMRSMGWRSRHTAKCLYNHAPDPYSCSLLGHSWFESASSRSELGDACWTNSVATAFQAAHPQLPLLTRTSSSGISLISLPQQEHDARLKLRGQQQFKFAAEFFTRVRLGREAYCSELYEQGYVLNFAAYRAMNPDLRKRKNEELMVHFWREGCAGFRPMKDMSTDYLYAVRNKNKTSYRNLRQLRRTYCARLKNSGWKLPSIDKYRKKNPDLKSLSDTQLIDHFWSDGCAEIRPFPSMWMGYTLGTTLSPPWFRY